MANDTASRLHAYARVAYERELEARLAGLDGEFGHWRAGRLSGPELNERIQRFQHKVRHLHQRYTHRPVDLVVADAIINGPLRRDEIDPPTLDALAPLLGALEEERDSQVRYDPSGPLNDP